VQTVIRTFSFEKFRRRSMALDPMTHVIRLDGGIPIGALAS
jgi:hypothetical protein